MHNRNVVITLACLSLAGGVGGQPLIQEGDLFRYFRGIASAPPDQGGHWTGTAYDDSYGWSEPLPSGFGFGDCDDRTEIGAMQNQHLSLYVRTRFALPTPPTIQYLTLAVDYDDGFVAYINGQEVARRNMPGGGIQYNTAASGNHEASRGGGSASPNEKEWIALDPGVLQAGTNVLALSGHNVSIGSSDFTLIPELYANASLVRGPFIQMPEPGAVTVAWSTAAELDGAVDYGLDLAYASGTVSNSAATRNHRVDIPGLLPGTTYYYRVRSGGFVLSEGGTFTTRAGPGQPFRFAVIGDFGQGTTAMSNIADRINGRSDIDLLVTVGDNVYGNLPCSLDGAPGWYDPYFFRLYEPTMRRIPSFPAMGNHDADTEQGIQIAEYFHLPTNGPAIQREFTFSFEYGNAHFVVINSDPVANNDAAVIEATRIWLSNDLAAATAPWKLAFLHHPPFTSVSSHGDNALVKEHLVPLLKAGGVQVVFLGHNHFYERMNAIDGITYVITGASGAGLYPITERKPYSAVAVDDIHSYTHVEVNGPDLTLRQFDESGGLIDAFELAIEEPFRIDGLLDDASWLRAENGLRLYAAIRGNHLYVATQDAGEGSDHFIYVAASNTQASVAANWAKAGTILGWDAFLADENDGAYHRWFDRNQVAQGNTEPYRSMTSGLNNNEPYGTNGVLEGALDLPHHFGTFPPRLYLAAAPYQTDNGGGLVSIAQVPAGNGDGNLDAGEFLLVNTRDLALDLPVADPGPDQQVEAGMWAVVDGGGSSSPAGLALSWNWEQTGGPAVIATNFDQAVAALVLASNVPSATDVDLRLRVHDGRFDSDDATVRITMIPMVDTDGDGLSDAEETFGYDNLLTPFNPGGITSSPVLFDTDGDGVGDGEEAGAGTDPGNSNSVFRIVSSAPEAGGIGVETRTVSGRSYQVRYSNGPLPDQWIPVAAFVATSAISRVTDTNPPAGSRRYYRVDVQVP